MYKFLQILTISIIFLTSCSEIVPIEISDKEQYLIECELNPGQKIVAHIHTMGSFNNTTSTKIPEDLDITLYTGIDIEVKLNYDRRTENYTSELSGHVVNPSYTYRMEGLKIGSEIEDKFTASTVIPSHQKLVVTKTPSQKNITKNNIEKIQFALPLSMPSANEKSPFYRIEFFEKGVNGVKIPVEFLGYDDEPLAFQKLENSNQVLFDINRVDKNDFTLNVSTCNKNISKIYMKLDAITESAYRYFIAKNKQLKAEKYGTSDPVINYTNIQNSCGFFGGSSSMLDSIVIK